MKWSKLKKACEAHRLGRTEKQEATAKTPRGDRCKAVKMELAEFLRPYRCRSPADRRKWTCGDGERKKIYIRACNGEKRNQAIIYIFWAVCGTESRRATGTAPRNKENDQRETAWLLVCFIPERLKKWWIKKEKGVAKPHLKLFLSVIKKRCGKATFNITPFSRKYSAKIMQLQLHYLI